MARGLDGVKAGDVIVTSRRMGGGYEIYRVKSVGKARVNCGAASFMLESGVMVGTSSTWNTRYGRIANAEDLARVELDNRMRAAKEAMRRLDVTENNLEAAEAFIAASQKKEPV